MNDLSNFRLSIFAWPLPSRQNCATKRPADPTRHEGVAAIRGGMREYMNLGSSDFMLHESRCSRKEQDAFVVAAQPSKQIVMHLDCRSRCVLRLLFTERVVFPAVGDCVFARQCGIVEGGGGVLKGSRWPPLSFASSLFNAPSWSLKSCQSQLP
jgi:hypothetical protein